MYIFFNFFLLYVRTTPRQQPHEASLLIKPPHSKLIQIQEELCNDQNQLTSLTAKNQNKGTQAKLIIKTASSSHFLSMREKPTLSRSSSLKKRSCLSRTNSLKKVTWSSTITVQMSK